MRAAKDGADGLSKLASAYQKLAQEVGALAK
jgi:hypothetical protein